MKYASSCKVTMSWPFIIQSQYDVTLSESFVLITYDHLT